MAAKMKHPILTVLSALFAGRTIRVGDMNYRWECGLLWQPQGYGDKWLGCDMTVTGFVAACGKLSYDERYAVSVLDYLSVRRRRDLLGCGA
jgi:hypothetical protein